MVKKKRTGKPTKEAAIPIVIMVCKDHEDYQAIYPPKTSCLVCWKIYATRMRLMVKALKIELKELKNAKRR